MDMEKYRDGELEAMIPSKDVREYVIKTGWSFSDAQKATLLTRIGELSLEDQFRHLRTLRDSTGDMELKAQITTYLDRMEQYLRELKDNRNRSCIYILKIKTDENRDCYGRITPAGYFFDYEMACEYGRKQNQQFKIEKLHVTNTKVYRLDDDDNNVNFDYVVTSIHFDRTGKAIYLSHDYDEGEEQGAFIEEEEEEEFIDAYFQLPNPFERGDVVRVTGSDQPEYGIVETSQKKWRESNERLKHLNAEFLDNAIRIALLCDDGTFGHVHITPLHLERYQPEWGKSDTEEGVRDNLLLEASWIYQGDGSLDELWYSTMKYREVMERKEKET